MTVTGEIFGALGRIIASPFRNLSALWVLAPVFLLWIILIIYFDQHKKERLGWNTALGNGISMFWISVTLMKHIFETESFTLPKLLMVIFILVYAAFIAIISFRHSFSAKVTYTLAYPTPIYFLSGVAILVTYGNLEFDKWVFLGLVIIFLTVLLADLILRKVMPESEKDNAESNDDLGGSSDLDLGKDFDESSSDDPLKDLKL